MSKPNKSTDRGLYWAEIRASKAALPFLGFYRDPSETPTLRPSPSRGAPEGSVSILGEEGLVILGPQKNPHLR